MAPPQQEIPTHNQHNVQKSIRKLQVGVVGLGRMGRRHAENILHRVPQAALLCACSPAQADLTWAEESLAPHQVRVYPSFEELIETPGLEAVIIASATHVHASQSLEALRRGLHVLCEKPVCKTLAEVSTKVVHIHQHRKLTECYAA